MFSIVHITLLSTMIFNLTAINTSLIWSPSAKTINITFCIASSRNKYQLFFNHFEMWWIDEILILTQAIKLNESVRERDGGEGGRGGRGGEEWWGREGVVRATVIVNSTLHKHIFFFKCHNMGSTQV